MPSSPFPGMDPYLERFWGDVHLTLIVYGKLGLQTELPEDLRARAQEQLVRMPEFETTHRFIEIVDVSSERRVVSVIEFVSPTSKQPGDGRDKYLQKRDECLQGGVSFVEIDLTREGTRELMARPWQVPASHQTIYQCCVFRATHPDHLELYAMPLWTPLPEIRIPLRPADEDVRLALQPLIDEIYERGQYDVDYTQPCRPPLGEADASELARRLASGE